MAEAAGNLFPELAAEGRTGGFSTGVLPSQRLREMIGSDILIDQPLDDDQIQPSSIDLRLGDVAWRVRASFLPGPNATVEGKLRDLGMHQIDLTNGAVLERGCVYIVPLLESVRFTGDLAGVANPKSSTGRLDIFTRVIADYATEFDRVPKGHRGRLYAEVSPRTFSVVVRRGSRLAQLRLRRGTPVFGEDTLERLQQQYRLVDTIEGERSIRKDSIAFTLDLDGAGPGSLVGYRAKQHTDVIDVDRKGALDPDLFWEPIHARSGTGLILNPDDFYILATRERVKVPPEHAAEMVAYDTLIGEFRVHYAGFFDPGFGWSANDDAGSRAVLEVRSHEVPFLLEHGQIVGRLRYERLTEAPDKLYGADLGSHYQGQALALSKHFRKV
ncbi:MAG: 2'-deoxycytidine 5'-triphosphate deaminase [Proteobacteria bacterium]|jgi:dCTP deaminase|nr:2'-deoxycytidine 5'-triphosphate deaminase [Pseudomonadota bacterium]MDA0951669.1 2'-deoxycytidine 5'-triphosphate deaminase [Pseudomonadota bacterium]MDA1073047.1 2'-deoxycytidine 5'-triphosphate deaminase [Pseudomonadota bacterium]